MGADDDNYGGFGLPFAVFVIAGWASINLALNFFNSYALRPEEKGGLGFSFPFVYSGCHQIASFIGVNVIFKVKPNLNTLSRAQWKAKWPALLGLSVMMVLNIGCNNASLVYVGLSVNQIIKSITPLPTMILSYFTEDKRYTWTLVGIVMVQVLGAIIAVPWHEQSRSGAIGIVLCFISMLAAATKPVVAGVLMKDMRESGLTPLVLVWYDSIFSIFWFFLISLCLPDERVGVVAYMQKNAALGWGLILIGSSMAFVYNIVVFYLTKVTSALTNVVLANVKQVILIVVAAVFVDHITRWHNILGIVIFFLASFAYSYYTFTNKALSRSPSTVTKPADESTGLVKEKSNA
jgi:drug/metabolite transporter (DMT)-like permease